MNVVPTPTSLSAVSVPPSNSTDFLAMDSPNPRGHRLCLHTQLFFEVFTEKGVRMRCTRVLLQDGQR